MNDMTGVPAAPKEKNPRDPEKWYVRAIEKYRRGTGGFRPNAAFFELADPLVREKKTLLNYDAMYVLWQVIHNLVAVPGGIAEIGAYRGGSAYFIASVFASLAQADVPFDVFDTFEGHPQGAMSDQDPLQQPGHFIATSYSDVRTFLSPFANVRVHQGDILTVLPHLAETQYRLVHIDTDLYLPTKACLEYFGPRLSSSGVFIVDDYEARKCAGVRAAVDEHLNEVAGFQVWDMRTEQLVLVKC